VIPDAKGEAREPPCAGNERLREHEPGPDRVATRYAGRLGSRTSSGRRSPKYCSASGTLWARHLSSTCSRTAWPPAAYGCTWSASAKATARPRRSSKSVGGWNSRKPCSVTVLRADERTLTAITFPDRSPHGCRNVTRAGSRWARCARLRRGRELGLFEIGNEQRHDPIQARDGAYGTMRVNRIGFGTGTPIAASSARSASEGMKRSSARSPTSFSSK